MFFRKKDETAKSGWECWFCNRGITKDGAFLTPEDVKGVFHDVFTETEINFDLSSYGVCQICAGLLKFIAQDSVAARIKINEASAKLKDKAGNVKESLKSKAFSLKSKIEERRKDNEE